MKLKVIGFTQTASLVIVYNGSNSQKLALEISQNQSIPTLDFETAYSGGVNRQDALFLYDSDFGNERRTLMKTRWNQEDNLFTFAVAVSQKVNLSVKRLRSLAKQLIHDYVIDLDETITRMSAQSMLGKTISDDPGLKDLSDFLLHHKVVQPKTQKNWVDIQQWFLRARTETSTVFVMVCPDYETVKDEDTGHENYSFSNRLHSEIGLVARKALTKLPLWQSFFNDHNLHVQFEVGMADYEATPENLSRLHETDVSFFQKTDISLQKIHRVLKQSNLNATTFHILRKAQEKSPNISWGVLLDCHRDNVQQLVSGLPKLQLRELIAQRKGLYERWYPGITKDEIINLLAQHGAEYSACAEILRLTQVNPLVISFNSMNMELFYRMGYSDLPHLQLSSVY